MDIDLSRVPSPCYILDERSLRRNLAVIADVAARSGTEIIVALKANAMWSIFPVMKEYVHGATASSLAEARLVYEKFGVMAHTYAPVYAGREFEQILSYTKQITFNSLTQFEKYGAKAILRGISCGIRINPGYSPVETFLYNPCSPGSRLGVTEDKVTELPEGIEGLHFHSLCESYPEDLERTLQEVEKRYGHLLPRIKWLNMGGGHLMTRSDYDCDKLVGVLRAFRERHPHLHIILEPGSAFTWETGVLVMTIEDIVENDGVRTLMIDASFACHMPDCLEMPYKPRIMGARDAAEGDKGYRVGGNSCLAGDFIGEWTFDRDPKPGDRLVFEDMIHYTMVKTTMFNGVSHPSIAILHEGGEMEIVREFGYEDYRDRMS